MRAGAGQRQVRQFKGLQFEDNSPYTKDRPWAEAILGFLSTQSHP
jgi:hypothetical protein